MKYLLYFTFLFIGTTGYSQTSVLFSEDFETSPVTNFLNTWTGETQLPDGASPCGSATRGNTTDFNSTNVDFNSAQNPGYFLGVNPESPCGGFYNASLHTPTLDLSGTADSIVVSVKYFITSTIGWGGAQLQFIFDNGTVTDTMNGIFNDTDVWRTASYTLPATMQAASVDITLNMGGGEAVGVDDFTVTRYLATSSITDEEIAWSVYPNPTNGLLNINTNENVSNWRILSLDGKIVMEQQYIPNQPIDVSAIPNGTYLIEIRNEDSVISRKKISKQ
ncbi:MAG: T9SS type A sorting domain-containing protein [Crocinitomicaceae bacterium]|nr:T9SS type A sorting domain-containing protein [Crocinitomicaceae bacterium]